MELYGWSINLTGSDITVYGDSKNFTQQGSQIGKLLKNECFTEGTAFGAGWEGWGSPVIFKNSSGVMAQGAIGSYSETLGSLASFASYAYDGTNWVSVTTLKRKVQYTTRAYYADGGFCCELPIGSYVWLTQNCTCGDKNKNYVAVTSVQTADGKTYSFSGNGFVDLTYGNRWLTVGNILLRKA